MKKTIIRIVAVAMLALMVLTAIPAMAVTFYGVAAAQTPVYQKPNSSKVVAYVTGQVVVNRQDRSSGMYNVTASYGGSTVTGWVSQSALTSFSKDTAGTTGTVTSGSTSTSTSTSTSSSSTASGTYSANLAAGTTITDNGKTVGRVQNAGSVTVNYRDASGTQVYVTIGSTSGWVPASAISNLRSSSSGSISVANLPTSGSTSVVGSSASGVKLYDAAKTAVSQDSTIYIRPTATSSTSGATKLRSMKGKTFTVLGTDATGSFLYVDYNGTKGFVRAQDFTFTSATVVEQNTNTNTNLNTVKSNSSKSDNTPAGVGTGSSSEQWGSITIPGAGTYPIYGNYVKEKNGKTYYYYDYTVIKSYKYVHTTTAKGSQIAVVMGHNMRTSKTYFHNLHHIQNAMTSGAKCESCKASVSGYGSQITANWEGYKTWQVVCFYEVPKGNSTSILAYNVMPGSYSTADYLATQKANVSKFGGYCNSSALTNDGRYMMLITCGDKYDSSSNSTAKLYMLLKAVG